MPVGLGCRNKHCYSIASCWFGRFIEAIYLVLILSDTKDIMKYFEFLQIRTEHNAQCVTRD